MNVYVGGWPSAGGGFLVHDCHPSWAVSSSWVTLLNKACQVRCCFAPALFAQQLTALLLLLPSPLPFPLPLLLLLLLLLPSSRGPLGWLVPSEIQPLETRAAGTGINTFVNFIFTFIIGQCFLSMLCAMKFGVRGACKGCVCVWVCA